MPQTIQKRQKRYHQNGDFINSLERFNYELRGTNIRIEKTPTVKQIESLWKPLKKASSYNKQQNAY